MRNTALEPLGCRVESRAIRLGQARTRARQGRRRDDQSRRFVDEQKVRLRRNVPHRGSRIPKILSQSQD